MHLLHNQPEEVLFSHFVTTLNDSFEQELALADEGYQSGSETSNLPTPLRRTSRFYHISSNENIPFNHSTPHTTATSLYTTIYPLAVLMMKMLIQFITHLQSSTSLPLHPMGFAKLPSRFTYTTCDDLEEKDFQTVTIDDNHWTTDPLLDRLLCIHDHLQ